MAFDGLLLKRTIKEFNENLIGSRVDRITMPNSHEIVLHLRGTGKTYKLLLSTIPQEARCQITSNTAPNPEKAPLFCMVLRKHLENGKLVEITQMGLDRIMVMKFNSINEMGDMVEKSLILEVMHKHSNIILVENNRIIDAIHHVPLSISRYRQVLPGVEYITPPAQNKVCLWDESKDSFIEKIENTYGDKTLEKAVISIFDGLGPQSVNELIYRSGLDSSSICGDLTIDEKEKLYTTIEDMAKSILENKENCEIIYSGDDPKDFSAISLSFIPDDQKKIFDSIALMLDEFYKDRAKKNIFNQKKADILQIVKRETDRVSKKCAIQKNSIEDAKKADKYKLWGELLMANHYRLTPGKSVTVENYFSDPLCEITITLDPDESIIDNAQRFFAKYRKATNTLEKTKEIYEQSVLELDYLDSINQSLNEVTEISELDEIKDELRESEYIKSTAKKLMDKRIELPGKPGKNSKNKFKNKNGNTKAQKQEKGLGYETVEYMGFDIVYGKNNHQNEYITNKLSKPKDLWFHVQKAPSSHVIIRNPDNKPINDEVLLFGAKLCMKHSTQKGVANIDYTNIENVRKPKGSKPGMVLYENYKTIYLKD